ncbi:hypothetical protein ABIA43_000101 [Bradyrhizobium sp. USDA 328]
MRLPRAVLLLALASLLACGPAHGAKRPKSPPAAAPKANDSGIILCTPAIGCRPIRKGCRLERVGSAQFPEEVCS